MPFETNRSATISSVFFQNEKITLRVLLAASLKSFKRLFTIYRHYYGHGHFREGPVISLGMTFAARCSHIVARVP